MAYFLFIDESGHDRRASPYEVLAGVAIRDGDLWNIIQELQSAELRNFGRRYSHGASELKGSRILDRRTFAQRGLNVAIDPAEVALHAKACLDDGKNSGVRQIKALAMAKLAYVHDVFEICATFDCKAFASIVETDAHPTQSDGLRKDYAYLFERFYYFLEDQLRQEQGIIVFDELDKARSHILIDQAHRYFRDTATGRARSRLIVPEPFFVHSEWGMSR